MGLSSNKYALIAPRLETILAQKAAPKSSRMAKLWQFSPANPHPNFLKKGKEGTKGNFSKIAQKVALAWKVQKHSAAKGFIL